MTSEVLAPLGVLLRHARSTDPSAEEVLLFTFNHDLAFFERAALGLIQESGARITVIADARVAHHDLYAVRRAGTAYLPGLAWCSGAFHPKMLVIAGPEQATIAIGSGNLSVAGWQGNDELWSIHHAQPGSPSAVATGVALWLRALPNDVDLTEGVAEALARTANLLDGFADEDDETRFLHSLHQPILEQLPVGPVDHLSVYAPFHDPGAEALRALIERLEPTTITVAVQPSLTRIDGPAVARQLEGRGRILMLADSPYRHGKLIEWTRDGAFWALTGSPNLSRAAMLKSTTGGGNVEVAVLAQVAIALLPLGVEQPSETMVGLPYVSRHEASRPSTVILSAVRKGGIVDVRLARPLRQPAVVQTSGQGASPDEWRSGPKLNVGDTSALLAEDLGGGSRLRLRLEDGTFSTVAFVIDPLRVLRTRGTPTSGRRPPDLDQVLTDPRAAEQFWRILAELRTEHGRLAPAGPRAPGPTGASFAVGDWEEYLERCQGRVGATTLAFSLGIPMVAGSSGLLTEVDWDDEALDDAEVGGLDDDEPEEAGDETDPNPLVPSLHRAPVDTRKRYRAVADNLIHRWSDPDPHERLLALRLALVLVAGGAWDRSDHSWADLILDGVANLNSDVSEAGYEDAAGSLAALGLSTVRSVLGDGERTLTHTRFDRTVTRVGHLLVGATMERVATYAEGLDGWFPHASEPEHVLDLCDRLVNDDPIADAVVALAERGIAATATGRVIDLPRAVPEPLLPAWTALTYAERAPIVVIRANGSKGWATLLWRSPDLLVIQPGSRPATVFSIHYRYPVGVRPSTDIRTGGRLNGERGVDRTMAGEPLPITANEILVAVGLSGADYPS